MKNAYLINTRENHRKFYEVKLSTEGGQFVVKGTWGRLGQAGVSQVKYAGSDAVKAEKEFSEVLKTRYSHGYELVSNKSVKDSTPTQPKVEVKPIVVKVEEKKSVASENFGITEDKFQAYEDVRQSGVTNMFAVNVVMEISGLSKEECFTIMKHYGELDKLYPNVRG